MNIDAFHEGFKKAGSEVYTVPKKTLHTKTLPKKQLNMGTEEEHEHTNSNGLAKQIAVDHLKEDKKYYTHLKKMESQYKQAFCLPTSPYINAATIEYFQKNAAEMDNFYIWRLNEIAGRVKLGADQTWYQRLWTLIQQFFGYLAGKNPSPFSGHPNQAELEKQTRDAIVQMQRSPGNPPPPGNASEGASPEAQRLQNTFRERAGGAQLDQELANSEAPTMQDRADALDQGANAGGLAAGSLGLGNAARQAGLDLKDPLFSQMNFRSPIKQLGNNSFGFQSPIVGEITPQAPVSARPIWRMTGSEPSPATAKTMFEEAMPNMSNPALDAAFQQQAKDYVPANPGMLERGQAQLGKGYQFVKNMVTNPSEGWQAARSLATPANIWQGAKTVGKGGVLGAVTDMGIHGLNRVIGGGTGPNGQVNEAAARAGESGSYGQDVRQHLVDFLGNTAAGAVGGGGAAGAAIGGALDLNLKGWRGARDIGSTLGNLYNSRQQVQPLRPGMPKYQTPSTPRGSEGIDVQAKPALPNTGIPKQPIQPPSGIPPVGANNSVGRIGMQAKPILPPTIPTH